MRKLSEYSDQSSAQEAVDYLEIHQISSQAREFEGGVALWIVHENEMDTARELLSSFEPGAGADVGKKAAALRKQKAKEARPVFSPGQRSHSTAPVSWGAGVVILMLLCAVVALFSGLGSRPLFVLYIAPANLEQMVFLPLDWLQPWRLITPIFLHFGMMHLVFNMMWLHQLGGQIESEEGTARFLTIVCVTAALSNLAQYWLFHPQFGGMSGVNYALFGFVWMHSRYSPKSGYGITSTTTWLMMGWLVFCATGLAGPVANAAHAFGLIAGLALSLPSYFRFRRNYAVRTGFEPGSWEDLNVHGMARFKRLYFEPYLPAWFLLIALLVVAGDYF